jgi:DNA polymerase III subunit gamma/tau
LTKEAFNALLKTLEEPPKHAIFILATTDAHKVPITITSRCQRFNFRRVTSAELTRALRDITNAEAITIDEPSLLYIARRAEGSVRDAQSILEQVIAYCGKTVVQEKVAELLGVVGSDSIQTIAEAMLSGQAENILAVIQALMVQGQDLEEFYKELIEHFRNLLVTHFSADAADLIENSVVSLDILQQQGKARKFPELQSIFKFLIQSETLIKQSAYPRFTLEMVLLQASQLQSWLSFASTLETIEELGAKFANFAPAQPQADHESKQRNAEKSIIEQARQIFEGEIVSPQ